MWGVWCSATYGESSVVRRISSIGGYVVDLMVWVESDVTSWIFYLLVTFQLLNSVVHSTVFPSSL